MGVNNRARRAARARARRREQTREAPPSGADPGHLRVVPPPSDGPAADRAPTERALEDALVAAVAPLWERGWEPADVVHVVGRRLGLKERALAAGAVRAQVADLRATHPTMHPE